MHPLLKLSEKNDSELIWELKDLVHDERQMLAQILRYLREVENRKLYLERGHTSLFVFAQRELGYDESAAGRRIQAMRLLKDVPEVEKKIEEGKISLSVACKVQSFIRQENSRRREQKAPKLQTQDKLTLISKVENSSARQCDKTLARLSPESARPRDKTRFINEEITVVSFSAGSDLMKKIDRLKELTSHANPEGQYEKLFEQALDALLEKIDPLKKEERREKRKKSISQSSSLPSGVKPTHRHIPIATKDKVWIRDGGRCQYRDRKTGRVCHSKIRLQIDHRYPYSLGGEHDLKNLRLLCASHNRFAAREALG